MRLPASIVLAILAALLLPATGASATPILGTPEASVEEAQDWARARGATPTFVGLAQLYWRLAPERGVRPEIAYAQAAKETNFGRFTGVLDASFRNPCGLKRTAGGANGDPRAHRRFRSWRQGVTAHLDHLALYAGVPGYPKPSTPDPRHFAFLYGTAPTVEALGGAWAPSPSYGREIVRLAAELGVSEPAPEPAPPEPQPAPVPPPESIPPHLAEGVVI